MSEAESVTGVWVSLQEAAQRRGVSPDTIRNWIKARKVQSRRKELPQGFAYEVFLVDLESVQIIPPSPNSPPTSEPSAPQSAADHQAPSPNALTSWEPLSVDLTPLADLVRELASRVAELERENGALAEKLAHVEKTTDLAPSRPWWQWWRRNPPA